jgi:cytochrome c-type biogenesis protein CcmH/NrfG
MWRFARLAIVSAIALAAGCKKTQPRTEDIFQAQTLGLGYLDRGQLAEAETQFKSVISMAPDEPLGHAYLGLTSLRGSRFADAEKELRRAHDLDASNADIDLMLAKLYAVTGRTADARRVLDQASRGAPNNAHVLYALAELDRQAAASDSSQLGAYEQALRKALAVAPLNVALRLQLADVLLRRGQTDSVVHHLEDARRTGPSIPADARPALDTTVARLQAGKLTDARTSFDRFSRAMSTTSEYQTSLNDVKWIDGPLSGTPTLAFMPKSLSQLRGVARGGSAPDVRFTDATSEIGFATVPSQAIAVGDVDGDGNEDIFIGGHLYHIQGGQALDVTQRAGLAAVQPVFASFADVDNDGRLDLFVIGTDGRAHLFRNEGGSRFTDVSARAGMANLFGARKAIFADLDHDGDLDVLLVGGTRIAFYRNNGDGTFTEMADAMGFATSRADTRDVAFADFDGDGRTDVLVVNASGVPTLYHNEGGRRFADATAQSGLAADGGSIVRAADYDNDGYIDVLIAGGSGEPTLWLNNGNGTFRRDSRSAASLRALRGASDTQFIDYDNDGWLDLVATGQTTVMLRNDGRGKLEQRSDVLPASIKTGSTVAAIDIDNDGDMDLVVGDQTGAHLLRNDNGNARLSMQVRLTGLRTGAGKNNDFGIGSKLEVRAGDLYQTRVVTAPVTHFGLGPHLKADVIRIEWTNGVPQTVFFPGTDQDVIENEVLKGSCAFLYTWDGTRFRFVTDVMWRSALGMPMGLMAGGMSNVAAYAPAGASQEYLRISGDALKPRNGKYTLQLTEELWETAFADQLELLAVDHPDSVQVFVDEKFVPPGPVALKMFEITHPRPPVSAVDDRGNDVLPALRDLDDRYVANLTPGEYQGVVAPHDLIMDLGDEAGRDDSYLFLRGWIYPTDASINVALSQRRGGGTTMPSLDVRDAGGRWVNAIPSLSFPSGKSKTLVVPLAGIFRTRDHHVRIRTNMQIYWDQAFIAGDGRWAMGDTNNDAKIAQLRMTKADLHFRGYSRTYRKGGRYGPWWFDYDSVSRESPWRPITGAFTRFGDVLPLLRTSDDMYVIMAPGDEATLEFDAPPAPKPGWTRDFLLYTDGWIKDSDLNTAFGTTVEPLPYHAIHSYPYGPGDAYPSDSAHVRYRREYNTRVVGPTVARR